MRRSTVSKDSIKNMPRVCKNSAKIDINKLRKFCHLWSMNTPKEVIQKKFDIKQAQYYRYIAAAEEVSDDFILGMIDHGLVLLFRNTMERVHNRRQILDELIESAKKNQDENPGALIQAIKAADTNDKLYSDMLDDAKIVNRATKVLNKVIVNHTVNKQ